MRSFPKNHKSFEGNAVPLWCGYFLSIRHKWITLTIISNSWKSSPYVIIRLSPPCRGNNLAAFVCNLHYIIFVEFCQFTFMLLKRADFFLKSTLFYVAHPYIYFLCPLLNRAVYSSKRASRVVTNSSYIPLIHWVCGHCNPCNQSRSRNQSCCKSSH